MKKATKFDFKTLLVLLLSLTLCFSAVFAACNKTDDSSSSSSSSTEETKNPTDTQLLKNGDFEYSTFSKKDSEFPVPYSIGWTLSNDSINSSSAPSSSSSFPSGIIDTRNEAYKLLSDANKAPETNPGTPEALGFVKNTDEKSELFVFDKETANTNDDKLPTSGTKILMLHNQTSKNDEAGTARKFTSGSVTLSRNEFAELSVWIKTVDLSSKVVGQAYGAYIAVQSTISTSADPFILKNINTKGEWAKYTIYLNSSDFSTSSFKVVLGLGFGSAEIADEYVKGYAFFDNAYFRTLNKSDYDNALKNLGDDAKKNIYDGKDNLVVSQENVTFKSNSEGYDEYKYSLSHTKNIKNTDSAEYADKLFGENVDDSTEEIAYGVKKLNEVAIDEEKRNLPGATGNETALYFNFTKAAVRSYTTGKIQVPAGKNLMLTFWMKAEINDMDKNGLTAVVKDLGKKDTNEEGDNIVKTTLFENQNTNDYENENYNGWRQYVLLVSNDKTAVREFEIEFTFGPTADDAKDWDYTRGFAVVTDFQGWELSSDDFAIADTSSYSYSKKVALSADLPNGEKDTEENNDSYTFSYSESEKLAFANTGKTTTVNGYRLVKGGSTFVGGTDNGDDVYGYNAKDVSGGLVKNPAGLKAFGSNKDLLSMYIEATTAKAYGFIGSSATFAANTTTFVTVSMYATKNAVANFYLTSPDALDGFKVIALSADSYTFDKEKLTTTYGDELFSKKFTCTYSNDNDAAPYWYTFGFLVTTGNKSITYRPEFWLGSRDGTTSTGTVYFDNYSAVTVNKTEKIGEIENMDAKEDNSIKYTRVPSVVSYNKVTDELDSSSSSKTEIEKGYVEYEETTVYSEYNVADETLSRVFVYDFSTIDVEHTIDNTTGGSDDSSSSTSSSSASDDGTSLNWALQITSIIIAVIIIGLLIFVLIRSLLKNRKFKKTKSLEYYSRDSREIAGEKAIAKKLEAERKAKEAEETAEKEEYDYDNPEINNNDRLMETPEQSKADEANETTDETTGSAENEETTAEGSETTDGGDGDKAE